MKPCPGRDAAFFMPLRRTGTVPGAGVWYDPGSAVHRQQALHRVRDTSFWLLRQIFKYTGRDAGYSGLRIDN